MKKAEMKQLIERYDKCIDELESICKAYNDAFNPNTDNRLYVPADDLVEAIGMYLNEDDCE